MLTTRMDMNLLMKTCQALPGAAQLLEGWNPLRLHWGCMLVLVQAGMHRHVGVLKELADLAARELVIEQVGAGGRRGCGGVCVPAYLVGAHAMQVHHTRLATAVRVVLIYGQSGTLFIHTCTHTCYLHHPLTGRVHHQHRLHGSDHHVH
jgi:hypothetical protein